MTEGDKWTKEWPTEAGHYWLYGWYKSRPDWKRILLVRFSQGAPGSLLASSGAEFIFQGEMTGVWMRAELPTPPKEEDLIDAE